MKIVMVGPFALHPKGTVSVRALPLARALVRRGHQVTLIIPPWDYPQHAGYVFEDQGVKVCNISLPTPLPLVHHVEIVRRLVRAAQAERPDVVHAFKPKSYAGLSSWLLWHGRRFWKPLPRLVMDTDDWEGPGGWNEMAPYNRFQHRFFVWQERWGLAHADAITLASRALQTIVWSLGVTREQVFYLPNGVPVEPPVPEPDRVSILKQEYGLQEHPSVLLYTRFFEFRLERVVAVWQKVLARCPDVRLLVVGKGLYGEETKFRELMADAGLTGTVIETGWVQQEDLPNCLAMADLSIFPMDDTLINRTKCPVKLADLMVAGIPIVAESVGQVNEYIESGKSGLLVSPNRPAEFADVVLTLLNDPEARQMMGREAQQRVKTAFSWDRLASLAEAAYGYDA